MRPVKAQEGVLVLPVGEHAIGLQIKGLAGKSGS